jgi:hypothetical protein
LEARFQHFPDRSVVTIIKHDTRSFSIRSGFRFFAPERCIKAFHEDILFQEGIVLSFGFRDRSPFSPVTFPSSVKVALLSGLHVLQAEKEIVGQFRDQPALPLEFFLALRHARFHVDRDFLASGKASTSLGTDGDIVPGGSRLSCLSTCTCGGASSRVISLWGGG